MRSGSEVVGDEGGAGVSTYRDLRVWSASVELAVGCYEVTKAFPNSETYGMTSQIRRSATSVAANIAEGFGREGPGHFLQFLRVAQGSLKELETHLIIATRVGLLQETALEPLLKQCDGIGKMLRGLMRSVERRTR